MPTPTPSRYHDNSTTSELWAEPCPVPSPTSPHVTNTPHYDNANTSSLWADPAPAPTPTPPRYCEHTPTSSLWAEPAPAPSPTPPHHKYSPRTPTFSAEAPAFTPNCSSITFSADAPTFTPTTTYYLTPVGAKPANSPSSAKTASTLDDTLSPSPSTSACLQLPLLSPPIPYYPLSLTLSMYVPLH